MNQLKQEIFSLTDGGKNIFSNYIPNMPDSVRKKFKVRDEKTPSASIKLVSNPNGDNYWILKDFGASGKAINAIDYVMQAFDLSFLEACKKVVQDMSLQVDIDSNSVHDWKLPEFHKRYDVPTNIQKNIWERRRIGAPRVEMMGLFMQPKFIVEAGKELDCLVFPYYEDGVIVNAKNGSARR